MMRSDSKLETTSPEQSCGTHRAANRGATLTYGAWEAPLQQARPVRRKTGRRLARSGQGWPLPSETREAICLLYQLSPQPTYPKPSVMTFSCSHFWQLPDTVSQTSLGANYHTNCQSRKHCLIAVLHQRQRINPSLTRQLKINKNATLTYIQLSGETICPRP